MNTVEFWWPVVAIVSAIFIFGFVAGRFSKAWRSAGNIVGTLVVSNDENQPIVVADFWRIQSISELKDGSVVQMGVKVLPGQRPAAEKTPTNME